MRTKRFGEFGGYPQREMLTWKEITFLKNRHLEKNPTLKIDPHTWKEFTLGEEAHLVKILTWKIRTVGKVSRILDSGPVGKLG